MLFFVSDVLQGGFEFGGALLGREVAGEFLFQGLDGVPGLAQFLGQREDLGLEALEVVDPLQVGAQAELQLGQPGVEGPVDAVEIVDDLLPVEVFVVSGGADAQFVFENADAEFAGLMEPFGFRGIGAGLFKLVAGAIEFLLQALKQAFAAAGRIAGVAAGEPAPETTVTPAQERQCRHQQNIGFDDQQPRNFGVERDIHVHWRGFPRWRSP